MFLKNMQKDLQVLWLKSLGDHVLVSLHAAKFIFAPARRPPAAVFSKLSVSYRTLTHPPPTRLLRISADLVDECSDLNDSREGETLLCKCM